MPQKRIPELILALAVLTAAPEAVAQTQSDAALWTSGYEAGRAKANEGQRLLVLVFP